MRLANLAISKYAKKEPLLIPFTKCWTKSGSGTKIKDFNVQRIFEAICNKSIEQGNFYWGLNAHPYCDMKQADVFFSYESYRPVDLSTAPDYIDIINLEAYDIILSQDFTLYKGEMRPVYILEGGLGSASNNELDQKKQAASMGYYLLEAHLCKAIKGFIYYRAYDAGESGKFGLMTSIDKGLEHKLSYDLFCEYEDESFSFDEWNNKYVSYLKVL